MAEKGENIAFFLGGNTLPISVELHRENRQKLCKKLKGNYGVPENAVAVLQGGCDFQRYCSDVNVATFRQESYFAWLFGGLEPNFYGLLDVDSGQSIVFIPKLPAEYATIMGDIKSPEHYQSALGCSEVRYVNEMEETIRELNPRLLLTLHGLNTDSGSMTKEAVFDGISKFKVDNKLLHPVLAECRVTKSPREMKIFRYTNKISSEAHIQVMKRIRPGMMQYQAESIFLDYCYRFGGMRHVSYTCICASGHSNSVLHYGHAGAPNDHRISDGEMCLFDMGGEYYCYTSDITCSFPVNGHFTEKQKIIYNAVLKSNRAVLNAACPGISWMEMHLLSERVLLEELRMAGLVVGEIDEMMAVRLGAVFYPHGMGHLLGLDVHDVGGYPEGHERSSEAGLRSLRTARVLLEGMVLTIEPGCYFIDHLLDPAFENPAQSRFLVRAEIDNFRGFGGVRIEDNIAITEDGAELLTNVPRTVEEIEAVMAAGRLEFPNEQITK